MLKTYRVLDLTDEKGLMCGRLFADLGAEVIKVERPGGDHSRLIGPFYQDDVNSEKSLLWLGLNVGKKSITLDIETPTGRDSLKRLAGVSDLIIESFAPGYLDRLGIGYANLRDINTGLVMVSITPFGQTGLYSSFKANDLILSAMSGQLYPCGDADRPPVHMSHEYQAYFHASTQAAVGAMLALLNRNRTGSGDHVDVSIQEAAVETTTNRVLAAWDMMRVNHRRAQQPHHNIRTRRVWTCKDGFVIWIYWSGLNAKRWNVPLSNWMESEGMGDAFLSAFDWDKFDLRTTTQEIIDRLELPMANFFASHTKAELYDGALTHGVMLCHVATTQDIANSPQLAARGFWQDIKYPHLERSIKCPGPFLGTSGTIKRRAPLIGEHNSDESIYKPSQAIEEFRLKKEAEVNKNTVDKLPLQGIKVADFTWATVGPVTTKNLSDFGATVIKIEGVGRPAAMRMRGVFKDNIPGYNRSGHFNHANTGKLSVTLDLTNPKGIVLARRLCLWADIIVDNFAAGTMKKLGFGFEELSKLKPEIVMLSSSMQGQTGPHAARVGFGPHLAALTGYFHLAGWPDRPPSGPDESYTDFISPRFNALAILSALEYRRRTGRGQYLDMSQYEMAVQFLIPYILDYTVNNRIASRIGNACQGAAPHGVYRCLGDDRWCAIAVMDDSEWQTLCKVMGNVNLIADPRFATSRLRIKNRQELDQIIENWTISNNAEDLMASLQASGVPAGVLQNGEDLMEHDPQLKNRGFFSTVEHPEIGVYHPRGHCFMLSKSMPKITRAPLLGENTEYVLKEILAMSEDEISEFTLAGAIQ